MIITISDHMRVFPHLTDRTARREMSLLRISYGWKHRKLPTLQEYKDYFDLDETFILGMLGLLK